MLLPDGWMGEVFDLSATGIRVRTVAVIPRTTDLEGTLILPNGEQVALHGRVVWATPPDHLRKVPGEIGIELRDVPERYFSALARFFADQPYPP
jgi:PilZ domain